MTVFEIKEKITSAILEAVKEHGVSVDQINLEHPEVESFGDYSCNIALRLSKTLKKNPISVAEEIKANLYRLPTTDYKLVVDKVDVVAPGFINFWIKKEALLETIQAPYEFPKTGKKVMVEFTDPNPFKEFHIGHLYSNTVGEVLARLNEVTGNDVKRACYQGDVGMHVAKSLWGILEKFKSPPFCHSRESGNPGFSFELQLLENKSIEEKQKFLGEAYALGATEFEKNDEAKKEITVLNKKIYEKDPEIYFLYEKGRAWSLEYFESIYERLGMKIQENGKHFNFYYFESLMGVFGLEFVKKYLEKGIFVSSEGAVIFPGEKYGLHNRVFINSLGLPTYEAKELGLAPSKYQDFKYDLSVIVTGNEINEYFKVLLKVLSLISPDLAEKTHHLGHGMVKLPTGKMSSRTGDVVTGVWLLDEVKNKIKNEYQCDDETAEKIGLSAIKYALLKSGLGKDVIFDLEKSIAVEGNSGPYLMYTLVRTKSVLQKITNYELLITNYLNNGTIEQLNNEELSLIRALYQFSEVVKSAAENDAPNLLCNFLYDLAQKFNTFYGKHRIVDEETVNEFRLFLTQKTGEILEKGMKILNLPVVEKM
jgi:arginyl-tRNA synthetase